VVLRIKGRYSVIILDAWIRWAKKRSEEGGKKFRKLWDTQDQAQLSTNKKGETASSQH